MRFNMVFMASTRKDLEGKKITSNGKNNILEEDGSIIVFSKFVEGALTQYLDCMGNSDKVDVLYLYYVPQVTVSPYEDVYQPLTGSVLIESLPGYSNTLHSYAMATYDAFIDTAPSNGYFTDEGKYIEVNSRAFDIIPLPTDSANNDRRVVAVRDSANIKAQLLIPEGALAEMGRIPNSLAKYLNTEFINLDDIEKLNTKLSVHVYVKDGDEFDIYCKYDMESANIKSSLKEAIETFQNIHMIRIYQEACTLYPDKGHLDCLKDYKIPDSYFKEKYLDSLKNL